MIINTRADLEALRGTPGYGAALGQLKSSMTTRINRAVHPEGYGQPGYEGPEIEPVWEDVETLESVARLGFTKAEFLAACTDAGL